MTLQSLGTERKIGTNDAVDAGFDNVCSIFVPPPPVVVIVVVVNESGESIHLADDRRDELLLLLLLMLLSMVHSKRDVPISSVLLTGLFSIVNCNIFSLSLLFLLIFLQSTLHFVSYTQRDDDANRLSVCVFRMSCLMMSERVECFCSPKKRCLFPSRVLMFKNPAVSLNEKCFLSLHSCLTARDCDLSITPSASFCWLEELLLLFLLLLLCCTFAQTVWKEKKL